MKAACTGDRQAVQLYCLRSGPAVRGNGKAYYKLGISKQIDERVANINHDLRKLGMRRSFTTTRSSLSRRRWLTWKTSVLTDTPDASGATAP
jgi:hypothetical protein